jgi:hypothetical protein
MSSYNPPTEDITEFNTSLFNQPEETLSQAEADKLYLSKTKSDISTASSTTFNGGVNVGGMLSLKSGANTSELNQSGTTLTIANRNPSGVTSFINQSGGGTNNNICSITNTGINMEGNNYLFTKFVKSILPGTSHGLFDNMTGAGNLTIGGTATSNTIRGNTTFTQDATFNGGVNVGGTLTAKTNLLMNAVGFKPGNAIELTLPMETIIILSQSSGTSTTLELPPISLNEVGMVFTFIKRGAVPFSTTITATNLIYLSNTTTGSSSNTTLLDINKHITKLLVSRAGSTTPIWVEVTDYSILDREYNNTIYPRLAEPNTFTQNMSIRGTLDIVSGTNTNDLSISGGNATYTMNAGATTATTHLFNTYTNANVPKGSFQIGSTNVAVLDSLLFTCRQIRSSATSSNAHEIFSNILSAAKITMGGTASTNEIRGNTTFTQNVITNNLINLNASTYPLATAQSHLGYYIQSTGTSIQIVFPCVFVTLTTLDELTQTSKSLLKVINLLPGSKFHMCQL